MRNIVFVSAICLSIGAVGDAAAHGSASPTLDAIRSRGVIICGAAPNLPGFAAVNERGEWSGLYVDVCRAVAVAIFGNATKVKFVATTTQNRLPMLQTGEIDILASNTTWTLAREAALGLQFTGVTFYDGQGFLVRKSLGVKSAKGLDGATVCVQPGTTTELNLTDYFRRNNMKLTPLVIDNLEELRSAFLSSRCDAYTIGTAALAAFRAGLGSRAEEFELLQEIISKEPLGPVVRKGDQRWYDIVRWTNFAMLIGEEMGLSSKTIDQAASNPDPDVQRFLGKTGDFGKMLGIDNEWSARIVRQVGNYAESWDRNVAPLKLPRTLNRLWTDGGIHYPPPIR
ncbi:amino acid ABC transporter substrate-binding protein [Pseudorhodoplanes sinuspersici]|uniref:amino acid ABC transporter substrate-binding protein n=1 Tax=Pseudorhodoplanes sinuspersici TaxID=1235591 RepID=UPI00315A8DD9